MNRRGLCNSIHLILITAIVSLWTGCATYSTYTCPDPIGEIVRQDCDDYKVRYESLQASLSVSIGSVSVGGSMGHEQLRDPSELIQMMMHQTLALCHDYNACRVKNEEFSRRREEMDKTFTAVMAILDQLKSRSMSDSERKVLLRELVAILKPPQEKEPEKNTGVKTAKKPSSKWKKDIFRRETDFYEKSPNSAPGAPAQGELPKVIFVNMNSDQDVATKGFFGYLWGEIASDDDIKAVGPGGYSLLCELSRHKGSSISRFYCRPKRDGQKMPAFESMSLSYTSGLRAKTTSLGHVAPILRHADSKVWLAYQPDPLKRLPVVRQRPYLVLVTRSKKQGQFTTRCRKDGKTVKVGKSSVLKGDIEFNPYILLKRDVLALPFTVPTGVKGFEPDEDDDEDMKYDLNLKDAQGNWKCKLKLDGITVREVSFKIKANGLPDLHPLQKSSKVVSPWWLVDTKVIPNSFEQKVPKS